MVYDQMAGRFGLISVRIGAVLEAINDGAYGFCESCAERIPLKRLNVMPWARESVRCQTDIESQSQADSSLMNSAA
jgi:RNA polymerase-binding transcription factor DksA